MCAPHTYLFKVVLVLRMSVLLWKKDVYAFLVYTSEKEHNTKKYSDGNAKPAVFRVADYSGFDLLLCNILMCVCVCVCVCVHVRVCTSVRV